MFLQEKRVVERIRCSELKGDFEHNFQGAIVDPTENVTLDGSRVFVSPLDLGGVTSLKRLQTTTVTVARRRLSRVFEERDCDDSPTGMYLTYPASKCGCLFKATSRY